MNDIIKTAIEATAKRAEQATSADEAMKYAQASLNLAHAASSLSDIERQSK